MVLREMGFPNPGVLFLDMELAKDIVCDIVSSGGVVVTTPEAVKEVQSVDESTRIIKEILASGAIDNPKQWINVGPDFYNVRSELVVLHEVLLRWDRLYVPPPLRTQVLGVFHKAHQSKTGLNLR